MGSLSSGVREGKSVTDLPTIQLALAAAKDSIGAVGKTGRNTAQNFNFRGVDAVVNAAAPALNKHGIIVTPSATLHTYEMTETASKKTAAHVILEVAYTFTGPAGDDLTAIVLAEAMDFGDKGIAKAMSVAYRTVLLQVLNLPTDEPDPDESSFERGTKPSPEERSPRPVSRTAQSVPKTAQELADTAWKATTPEAVRGHYATAGTQGWLKHDIAHPQTAEKMTVEAFLTAHGNDLKHSKSPGAAAKSTSGKGAE